MGIDVSMQSGYGFLVSDLEEDFKTKILQAEQDDLTLFEVVEKELTMEDAFEAVEEFYSKNTLEECRLQVFGNYLAEGDWSIVVFLENYEQLSLEDRSPEKTGAVLFDDEIPVSNKLQKELDMLKKYFVFFNEVPKPISAIRVS